jgi:seryl-tRNA synthetase
MSSHFYSTTACAFISYWPPEVAGLIYAFALQKSQIEQKPDIIPTSVTSDQVNQARDDSYDLVKEYLAGNAKWQEILNETDARREKINADIKLVTEAIQKLLEKSKSDPRLKKLEQQHKSLKDQQQMLDDFEKQLATWRKKELNLLKDKWQKSWQEHKAKYIKELITQLKTKGDITLSDFEQAELKNPTKTREELLFDLKKFYPKGLPKGWKKDSDLFKLRALWVLEAYSHRTLLKG